VSRPALSPETSSRQRAAQTAGGPSAAAQVPSAQTQAASSQAAPPPVPQSPPPELREKLLRVAGRVRQANAVFEQLQKDLAARGMSPSADLTSNHQQMKMFFDMGQGAINGGGYASAADALDRADAFATRLLKAGGR